MSAAKFRRRMRNRRRKRGRNTRLQNHEKRESEERQFEIIFWIALILMALSVVLLAATGNMYGYPGGHLPFSFQSSIAFGNSRFGTLEKLSLASAALGFLCLVYSTCGPSVLSAYRRITRQTEP
ncbi:MAG: hypothetical protein AAGK14_12300 [Verrucomicrobiota bacterium]